MDYVEGSVHNGFCTKLQCPSENISNTFNGLSGMIDGVPPNELCTLMVTDYNGMSFIDTRAAVTIENITVPITTVIPSTGSTNNTQTTPTEGLLNDLFYCFISTSTFILLDDNQRNVGIIISGGVAAFIVLAATAATLLITIICELLSSPCHVCENKLYHHNRYC